MISTGIRRRRSRLLASLGVAALLLAATGCEYFAQANDAATSGGPVPWFCNPVAPNSVTGSGMGSVNWYAGTSRSALGYEDCKTVAGQFDVAKAYAEEYPTLGSAEAAGFRSTFAFIPGMGTHHGLDSITPAMLADPTFNRMDPVIPNSIIDGTFDPAQPEFLQYNGNGPDAALIGMSYYVRTTNGLPPQGFVGNNDWWHHHPQLCLAPATATAFAVNLTDAQCTARAGVNLHMGNYYMLHLWLVDDLEYVADVHAPMHPCIKAGGAIFDMDDPCHDEWMGGAAAAPAAGVGASTRSAATEPQPFTCPMGLLHQEPAAA